jgi:hypothetical protein
MLRKGWGEKNASDLDCQKLPLSILDGSLVPEKNQVRMAFGTAIIHFGDFR